MNTTTICKHCQEEAPVLTYWTIDGNVVTCCLDCHENHWMDTTHLVE